MESKAKKTKTENQPEEAQVQDELQPVVDQNNVPDDLPDDIPADDGEVIEYIENVTPEFKARIPMIYSSIVGCMNDVTAVKKTQQNRDYNGTVKYNYRGIDDVMNALHPAMVKNGIFIVPEILENNREVVVSKTSRTEMVSVVMKIRYSIYAMDGSHIECTVIGEGRDAGDKASNKAMAVAMKYCLFQVFCLPTEEMRLDDPDRRTQEETGPADAPQTVTIQVTQPAQKAQPAARFERTAYLNQTVRAVGFTSGLKTDEDKTMFGSMVTKAIESGQAVNKKTGDMTDAEFKDCMDAVVALFGNVGAA